MRTNAKLAAGLVALVVAGAAGIALQRTVTMQHPAPAADVAAAAPQQQPPADTLVLTATSGAAVDEAAAAELEQLPGVAAVTRYLTGTLPDGSPIIGSAPLDAPLVTDDGQLVSYRVVAGRALSEVRPGQPAAVVGARWAASHRTVYNYRVDQMISATHAPLVELAPGVTASTFAVVETGNPAADASVYVPLDLARVLLDRPAGLDLLSVTAEPGADMAALEAAMQKLGLQAKSTSTAPGA
jgi:hypothetical protein